MAFYDRERGFRPDYGGRGGYGAEYSGWGDAWSSRSGRGFWDRGWGSRGGRGGYGGELYGGAYPTYGGYPGGRQRGMHYGGRGYGLDYGGRGGWGGGGWDRGGMGYDAGYAREPFIPEEAYHRHPEYNRPQRHLEGRWPATGHELSAGMDEDLDDQEVRQGVRQSLFQDGWLDAERIQVEVRDGVVTLSGEVDDYLEARYAWDDAWESPGVRGVVNNLTVRTDQPTESHGDPLPQSGSGGGKSR